MKIFDSNILIYSLKEQNIFLFEQLFEDDAFVSEVSKLEVLGYHLLTETEKSELESLFDVINVIPITSEIVDKAVELKQAKKMSVGDSIIAATALLDNAELHTNNENDFKHLPIHIINPLNS